jgi:hypothetical protein
VNKPRAVTITTTTIATATTIDISTEYSHLSREEEERVTREKNI